MAAESLEFGQERDEILEAAAEAIDAYNAK
jgi:hypothetical protein